MLVKLPEEVAAIYDAVRSLGNRFPDRKFTPDGQRRVSFIKMSTLEGWLVE